MDLRHALPVVLAVSLAPVALVGCDCAGPTQPPGPCQSSSPPTGCGATCDATRPCRAGLFCDDGTCTAECVAGEACTGGTCSADGRCIADTSDGGRDGAPFDGPRADTTCASVTIDATRVTPNVIVVIDRSGSMDEDFEGGRSRWDTLEDALLDMPDGPIFSLQSSVRFGIAMYTEEGSTCPALTTVPCAFDNYTAIAGVYAAEGPGGGTPTGQSMDAVLDMLATLAPVREDPTVIVLATDGEPDTCEDGDDEVRGRRLSVEAVRRAQTMDIDTYVISVGDDVGMPHLDELADEGRPDVPDAAPYVATDTAMLVSALEEIIGGVVSCELELEGTIDPAMACSGTVRLGTDVLECGTDWRAVDGSHIELLGAACDRLQTTDDPLSATFPCGVVIF